MKDENLRQQIEQEIEQEIKEIEMNMLRERCPKLEDITDQIWDELDINEFNREIAEEFLMENPDLRPKTLIQYKSGIRIFMKWLADTMNNKPIYEVKKKDFLRYQNFLIRRGMSSNGISFKRASVSTLCNYIENYYVGEDSRMDSFRNFVRGVKKPAPNSVYKKVMVNQEEYDLIKDTLLEDGRYRDYAMFVVAMETGMRGGELIKIKKTEANKSISKEGYFLTDVIFGKGSGNGKELEYMINQTALNAMRLYLEKRGEDNCEYMFVSKYNGEVKQLGEGHFEKICREVISDIVSRRINEHIFRASCASRKLIEGVPEVLVSKYILHHNDLSTLKYYDLRDFKEERAKIFANN